MMNCLKQQIVLYALVFDNQADNSKQLYNQRDEHPTQEFCARVVDYDKANKLAIIEQRNYFSVGDKIEFLVQIMIILLLK